MFCKHIYGVKASHGEHRGFSDGVCSVCQPFNLMRIDNQVELSKLQKAKEFTKGNYKRILELQFKIEIISAILWIRKMAMQNQELTICGNSLQL